jgi:hypothetical protein
MDDLNGTNNSDTIIINDDKSMPTINDLLNPDKQISLDDTITRNAEEMIQKSNIEQTHSDSERDKLPKVNINLNETAPLSLNILSKNKENESSGVIQVPQSIKSENQMKNSRFSSTRNTLNESVRTTINRDLTLIFTKIKYVVNPLIPRDQKNFHIRQWDLWGPLLLNMALAFTLSFDTKEKSQITTLIFVIFWLGGVILYLNANFLGVKASIFQILCLLGYCLFPLNLSAIIVTIFNLNDILKLILVMSTLCWSVYSSSDYLRVISNQEQRYLVLYPCILFYLYISWFIFSTKK